MASKTVWQAPEFRHREKEVSWYWGSIIVSVLILAAAVWQRNFLFAFFVIVAEILLIVWAERAPRIVEFSLSEKGLTIDGRKSYPLGDIRSFSSEEHEGEEWSELILLIRGRAAGPLFVTVPTTRLLEISMELAAAGIPQVPHEPSFIEILEKFLGF